eukprot:scaffold53944_cov76-Phaeocystis_antarctica.AAC.4
MTCCNASSGNETSVRGADACERVLIASLGAEQTTGRPRDTNTTGMVHGTWYRANSGQANVQAPSHAVPHAARSWRRPRHALRPQHAARSSARLPKHGAVGRRAMH